ncbi:hypothetical protein M5K25_004409 [Dendrobium thyrsiflorum]|uniref:Uncharacterized protein n=1 Tax=Dendrobium thyrsiflorum TaxID=117978 RepID=A0ABD0VMI9_DENTH
MVFGGLGPEFQDTTLVLGIIAKMAEGSRRVAPGEEKSLETLWVEHSGLVKHIEELAADFVGSLRKCTAI